ncbi:hypothetical protein TraAM80_07938 [Trypanosoma rangeli]|uniref:Uncharacterized protein n=1 Tax=Trypanosoma rangeli TaxID=5698 RepID=A0A3R7MC50_TRYRA|nr:uncharacterized protein TraAM80_07938 [Trypanosoma rangeli]RNE99876.1 hypothetical protein TraAM80_07938 [Trypanosoma rangeli]|eukprot:RNE99876.1 hypothetical protein TraAM80_07938 [Trypanosoma rangeli]
MDEGEKVDHRDILAGEDAAEAYLLDRIRQQAALEKLQGSKIVLRKGIPTPSEEYLASISEYREKQMDMMKFKRHIEAVERRTEVWGDHVSYEPASQCVEAFQVMHVETTSLEGRAVILAPLLAMFRMLICNNRAKKRLERLRKKQSSLRSELMTVLSERQTVVEAVSVVDEHMSVMPAYVNRVAPLPKLFLMTTAFDVKPLRSPFVFLSRQYKTECLPEFSLDLSQAVNKEYAAYVKSDHNEATAVTLLDFVQPLVTLETFDVHGRAHDVVHRPNLVLGYDTFGNSAREPRALANVEKRDATRKAEDAASSVELSNELCHLGVPSKLVGPLPEDSISGSDSEDASPFHADVSWLPLSSMFKKNDTEEPLRS